LFEELPALIQQRHNSQEADLHSTTEFTCQWLAAPLQTLSVVAARCVRIQPSHRATVAEVLPELERLNAAGAEAALDHRSGMGSN
jgi:hypothetical protein